MSILKSQLKTLSVSLTDKILTVSLNRPKANAMSPQLLNELIQTFNEVSNDKQVKGILLRSNLEYSFRSSFTSHFIQNQIKSNFSSSSTFSSGADLSTVFNLSLSGQRSVIDKYIFDTLSRGMTAPIYCSKPVACSLNGHTIAGGLMLALSCDFISIGTKKPFRIGITGPIVGIPYPIKAVKLVQHQLEPQVAYRLLVDAQLFSSTDFPIRCERSDTPDDTALSWLKMVTERPLEGFKITKHRWWSDIIQLDSIDNEKEKEEYFQAVTSRECLQAMKNALTK